MHFIVVQHSPRNLVNILVLLKPKLRVLHLKCNQRQWFTFYITVFQQCRQDILFVC